MLILAKSQQFITVEDVFFLRPSILIYKKQQKELEKTSSNLGTL